MNKFITIVLVIFLAACASSKNQNYVEHVKRTSEVTPGSILLVKMTPDQKVDFYGEVDLDDVNADHGSMMYVANTPGVFAASVLAHAVIAGSANDNQKAKAQEEANKVLLPYADTIDSLTEASLIQGALDSREFSTYEFSPWSESSQSGWSVVVKPVFLLSQDQRTMTLKNAVTLIANDNEKTPAYQNLIEVVSIPGDVEGVLAQEEIPFVAGELISISLAILEEELQGKHVDKTKQKTLSYQQGGKKKFERGVILSEQCDRVTFRSLRGWVKSVPGGTGECEVQARTDAAAVQI
ncbi:hypothetical protein [Microbulbifer sp. YPW1]|uniref:hypothetical protein n=1 Tax=Microbulbifer sp. YPW1 TaxID=2745199 RepID=UPI00159934A4|nr:hypothetical protein [Microbulbifer sp. YPW1]QKX16720.1 hypothetical protein HUW35_06785 [Microbulbifer sp. YPW1]